MKVIFNYTIPHTGTHFVMDMTRQGYDPKKWCQIDDMWYGNRYIDGHNFEDDFTEALMNARVFYSRMYGLGMKIGKRHKIINDSIDLVLVKGHHWHRGRPLEKLLKTEDYESDIKFVSSMRDPFLAIMTRSWQGWYGYGRRANLLRPEGERNREARRIVQTFVDILTVQPDRMYVLPIDGTLSKTKEGRHTLYERLYKHCGLKQNETAEEFVKDWKPVNTSASKSKGAGQEAKYNSIFEEMKNRYQAGDKKFITTNKFCNFEFRFLQGEEYLKRLIENAGYDNVMWW